MVTILEKEKTHHAEVALAQEQEESPGCVAFNGIRSERQLTFDDDNVYGFKIVHKHRVQPLVDHEHQIF